MGDAKPSLTVQQLDQGEEAVSPEVLSILALCVMFVIATILPINMGVLAFVGAFLVGTLVAGMATKDIIAGFPGGLFLTLVGITYLFALAQNNGTIDWLVQLAVRAVRGRIAAIPWIMFAIAAVLTSVGAVSPGAVAIIAPIALGFAAQYKISPLLMGLLVIHGAQAGGFSPISIYGGITNGVVAKAGLPLNELATMMASFTVNLGVSVLLFFVLGGRSLLQQRAVAVGPTPQLQHVEIAGAPDGHPGLWRCRVGGADRGDRSGNGAESRCRQPVPAPGQMLGSRGYQILTLAGILLLAVLTLAFKLDIGFVAITIGLGLSLIAPNLQKRAIGQVTWPEIMLITGVSTYVFVLEKMGTIDFVGHSVAGMGSPLLAALLLCLIGAVVSAFASSTAVLGSLIPLAVPFLQGDSGLAPSASSPPWRCPRPSSTSARSRPTGPWCWRAPRESIVTPSSASCSSTARWSRWWHRSSSGCCLSCCDGRRC